MTNVEEVSRLLEQLNRFNGYPDEFDTLCATIRKAMNGLLINLKEAGNLDDPAFIQYPIHLFYMMTVA